MCVSVCSRIKADQTVLTVYFKPKPLKKKYFNSSCMYNTNTKKKNHIHSFTHVWLAPTFDLFLTLDHLKPVPDFYLQCLFHFILFEMSCFLPKEVLEYIRSSRKLVIHEKNIFLVKVFNQIKKTKNKNQNVDTLPDKLYIYIISYHMVVKCC